jgi:hypothetical protein
MKVGFAQDGAVSDFVRATNRVDEPCTGIVPVVKL